MKLILKKEKGITLIALVVTIIVLIILAGVSINLVLGENYWLASRDVRSNSSGCRFRVCFVNNAGELVSGGLCDVASGGNSVGYSPVFDLRPCFALKSDIKITGGNGTSENPYTM